MNKKSQWRKITGLIVIIISLMLVIEYVIQTMGNKRNAEKTEQVLLNQVIGILEKNTQDEEQLLSSLKEDYMVRAKAVAYIIDHNGSAEYDVEELNKIARLISVDEIHLFDEDGVIYSGTIPKYYGLEIDAGEQISYFKPMLEDKTATMCQDVTPNTAEGRKMMYAMTWNEDGTIMIQVGIEPLRLLAQLKQNEITKVVSDMPMYEGLNIYVANLENGEIYGATDETKIGKTLDEIGVPKSDEDLSVEKTTTKTIDGKKHYCMFKACDSYVVGVTFDTTTLSNNVVTTMTVVLIYLLLAVTAIVFTIKQLFRANNERDEQLSVLTSMSEIYYSMHLINLAENTIMEYYAYNQVKEATERSNSMDVTKISREIMHATMSDEYLERGLEFTDVSTLAERMTGKKIISMELLGKNVGWIRMSFITIEADDAEVPKKVVCTTQIIDGEKRREESLIYRSNTDELTKCYNRRAYEDDILQDDGIQTEQDFVYVSMDVNGLKSVNDTLGHEAGDELIKGASECMHKCFESYGKVYRTGGDEFVALILADGETLDEIRNDFDKVTSEWTGRLIDSLTVSCGYVTKSEFPDISIIEMAKIADRRMYEAKSAYYHSNGNDGHGQMAVYTALCTLFNKIVKMNLTDDTFQIIYIDKTEQNIEKGRADKISDRLSEFAKNGQVHPDDKEEYLAKTDINFLKNHFREDKSPVCISYRKNINGEYKRVITEIIPANDYSDDNQQLFLYVKLIDK